MASKLMQMQARFQQKQMEEKEEKLLRLYESQQQRAFERVGRSSAGSNTSMSSTTSGGGKVRQMFDERRQKAGVDRSYPLQPLNKTSRAGVNDKVVNGYDKNRNTRVSATKTTVKSMSSKAVVAVRNSKSVDGRRAVSINSSLVAIGRDRGRRSTEDFDVCNSNERDYEDYDDVDRNSSDHDLIEMINNNNLNDNLEDEEIPSLALSEASDSNYSNRNKVNGVPKVKSEKSENSPDSTKKPIVRRSVIKTVNTPAGKIRSKTFSSQSTPVTYKSSLENMSKVTAKSTTPTAEKAPSTARPSAKQSGRAPVARDDLDECKYCGRRFATDRIAVHENICAKTGKKKRKTYDAIKHRVQGTDLEPFIRRGGGTAKSVASSKVSGKSTPPTAGKAPSAKPSSKKDWRRTHEEFIATIRAAKTMQQHLNKGGKLSDLPPPPPSTNPDYVQCPHCGRRFNEAAAERHIPKCANYSFNKPKPPSSTRQGMSGRK